ncbi:lactate dehydrogenase [Fructobacillus sp. M2-14]|uniref:Lactate dehydrogenase n=1 Tax=Fructobacillus broussonetiae TaxID=2713173 RepID=A0ABS5R0P8_9LACO|nr:NAD(P)-dependent oxidoreductase [Fructobacillus broussonetiae]MBS9338582.1 lactate dehydrogenase [Fructobacillus broussonetiae]
MAFKIISFGTRDNEISHFDALNKEGFELTYKAENLTHENIELVKGFDGVLLRANNVADKQNLDQMAEWGIKYVFTRTVGYNHIDLDAAKANGQIVAYVPAYSPYAVADLAFGLGIMQNRNLSGAVANSQEGDFRPNPASFVPEFQNLTVGIVGTGKIGLAEAKLWKGVGSKVLGYDPFPKDGIEDILTYASLEDLLKESDIVSLHVPYFKGTNDQFFAEKELKMMKSSAVLVNTARAEITDEEAIIEAVKNGEIKGFATDVISNERAYFGQVQPEAAKDSASIMAQFHALYPKIVLTPHIGSYTENALDDMISISYQNFKNAIDGNFEQNFLVSREA